MNKLNKEWLSRNLTVLASSVWFLMCLILIVSIVKLIPTVEDKNLATILVIWGGIGFVNSWMCSKPYMYETMEFERTVKAIIKQVKEEKSE